MVDDHHNCSTADTTTTEVQSTRKRKASQLFDATSFTLENDDFFSMLVRKHSLINNEVLGTEKGCYLICTSRLRRCFRAVQSVTTDIALKVLKGCQSSELFAQYRDEFVEWKVLHPAEYLRAVFHVPTTSNCSSSVRSLKRQRRNEENTVEQQQQETQVEKEREFVRRMINDYIAYLEKEGTSYDDLIIAIRESFCYHPTRALKLFQSALAKGRYHYSVYLHAMEPYRQSGQKLDCVKSLRYSKFLASCEAADIEAELRVESEFIRKQLEEADQLDDLDNVLANSPLIQALTQDMNEAKSHCLVLQGLIHFFSDGSTEDMFKLFKLALGFDPKSIYAYCNLGVLNAFNIHGSKDTCELGISLLENALQFCTVRDYPVMGSFLHHTIAQTYMRMNDIGEALKNIEMSLKHNPQMILAFFDRSSIYRNTNNLLDALHDNDVLIRIDPETPFELSNIYCNRAVLEFKLNREKEMFESLHKSVTIDPSNSFAYIMLSKQAILRNDFDSFEKLTTEIRLKDTTHITHYLQHLIEAYNHFGKADKVQHYQRLLATYLSSWFRIE